MSRLIYRLWKNNYINIKVEKVISQTSCILNYENNKEKAIVELVENDETYRNYISVQYSKKENSHPLIIHSIIIEVLTSYQGIFKDEYIECPGVMDKELNCTNKFKSRDIESDYLSDIYRKRCSLCKQKYNIFSFFNGPFLKSPQIAERASILDWITNQHMKTREMISQQHDTTRNLTKKNLDYVSKLLEFQLATQSFPYVAWIYPKEKFVDKLTFYKESYCVELLCQFPEKVHSIHSTKFPPYELQQDKEWWSTAKSWMRRLNIIVKGLDYGNKIGNLIDIEDFLPFTLNKDSTMRDKISTVLDHMDDLSKKIDNLNEQEYYKILTKENSNFQSGSYLSRAFGSWLIEKDKGNWGGLKPFFITDEIPIFLCALHYKEMTHQRDINEEIEKQKIFAIESNHSLLDEDL
jgi:hypothetical protein